MKNVLIVGATGNLGPHIVKALVKNGHQVSALMRSTSIADNSKTQPLTDQGVELLEGNFEDYDSLRKACHEKDVVISCAGADQILNQIHLARAAKESGVERFIPSEFGLDPFVAEKGSCDLFDAKAAVQEQIKETGVGFTPIYTNGFMEFWATGLGELGVPSPPDRAKVFGDGNMSTYMTALSDIGQYTAAIVEDPETINKEVLIATTSSTQNEMISLWEDISGKTVEKEFVSPDQLDETINASTTPESMLTRIFTQLHRSVWIKGEANKERKEVLNAVTRYPDIQPLSLKAYLTNFIG
ncbi:MAG: aromatic alcohol reductase [Eudoraea sp.]|nr:aromatic alcohol reductase [Eudoraea sp.]